MGKKDCSTAVKPESSKDTAALYEQASVRAATNKYIRDASLLLSGQLLGQHFHKGDDNL